MTTTSEMTYSSLDVARMVGVSYRQLDYWLRVGIIEMDNATPGSGARRVWTEDDVRRLQEILEHWREAKATLAAFRAGDLWRMAG